jgi:hypothetical protein
MFNPLQFYNFGKSTENVNTYIGNMGGTINTVALLATYLGVSQSRISKFKLTGLDIECAISGSQKYTLVGVTGAPITFFRDEAGKVGNIGTQVFRLHSNIITTAYFPGIINQTGTALFQDTSFPILFDLPNCVSLPNGLFGNCSSSGTRTFNIPKCLNIGATQGFNGTIRVTTGNAGYRINAAAQLKTSNNGGVEGDLADAITRGATVIYINL